MLFRKAKSIIEEKGNDTIHTARARQEPRHNHQWFFFSKKLVVAVLVTGYETE